MRHVSVFLLKQFVESAVELERADVAHVSACAECAASLKRLATRELQRSGVEATMPSADHRPALVAFMAAAAVLAVLIVNHPLVRPARTDLEVSVIAPEGRHGVPEAELFLSHYRSPLADAGARLGSE